MQIHALQGKSYILQSQSRFFPAVNLSSLLSQVMAAAREGTGTVLHRLRQQLGDSDL